MTAQPRTQTCAVCGGRDSTGVIDWDGRFVPSCTPCSSEVPDVAYSSGLSVGTRAVRYAHAFPGLSSQEIADQLCLGDRDRNAAQSGLSRAVRSGELAAVDRPGQPRRYHRGETRHGRIHR